jgi:predicted DNA-binding protein (UPF0251 family)
MGLDAQTGQDRWEREQVLKKLYDLSDTEALIAVAVKEMSRHALALYLGVSRNTIKNILRRANKKIGRYDSEIIIKITKPTTDTIKETVDLIVGTYVRMTGSTLRSDDESAYTIVSKNNNMLVDMKRKLDNLYVQVDINWHE